MIKIKDEERGEDQGRRSRMGSETEIKIGVKIVIGVEDSDQGLALDL
jgi:hypothetical protein